jgi:hypothetical protein
MIRSQLLMLCFSVYFDCLVILKDFTLLWESFTSVSFFNFSPSCYGLGSDNANASLAKKRNSGEQKYIACS